jgi:DNA-binding PadR family transcriptional regulator
MSNDQLYKGNLVAIILKLLKDNGRMYGYEITREVEKSTSGNLIITEGALYPTLHKLEAKGMVDVEMRVVNNRTRKYYFLTPKGKTQTEETLEEMKNYLQNMELLFNPAIQTVK